MNHTDTGNKQMTKHSVLVEEMREKGQRLSAVKMLPFGQKIVTSSMNCHDIGSLSAWHE